MPTRAELDALTKAEIAEEYGVSDDQTKDEMIAEVLAQAGSDGGESDAPQDTGEGVADDEAASEGDDGDVTLRVRVRCAYPEAQEWVKENLGLEDVNPHKRIDVRMAPDELEECRKLNYHAFEPYTR